MKDTPETDAQIIWFGGWEDNRHVPANFARKLEIERDEAQAALTTIHRWIKRNHPDGFIDSMNYVQNLERISDNWYDRFVRIERERDEAREKIKRQAERIRKLEGATNHAGGLYKQK
jgi:cell wall assembly regulator SMI1